MAIYEYLTDKGVIVPDTSDIRADVEALFRSLFGDDIDLSPETPQGVLVTMLTEERDGHVRFAAEVANQVNPDIANGVFIDAIGAWLRGQRMPATHTIINGVIFGGVPGTIIPMGSLVGSSQGDRFYTIATLTIGDQGTVLGTLRAAESGPVLAPVGSLNRVASSVLGWETVDNPIAGTIGRPEETDGQFKLRRIEILARNTMSVVEAIKSHLSSIPNVRSFTFRENTSDLEAYIDGVTMSPKSIWVCIDGGADQEIAHALMESKTAGAAFNGSVAIDYVEPISGQVYAGDLPVRIERPEEIQTYVRVTVAPNPLNLTQLVPAAVMSYSRGEIGGGRGFVVGSPISPFEIAGAINIYEPSVFVRKVEISTDGGIFWSTSEVELDLWQVARISESAVTLVTL